MPRAIRQVLKLRKPDPTRSIFEIAAIAGMTMANACPIPTPEERKYNDVFFRVTDEMTQKIAIVIEEAYKDAVTSLQAIGSEMDPPHPEFLTAIAEESLMLRMCGATAENEMVGKPAIAKGMAQNLLNRAGRWQSILDRQAADPSTTP